AFVEQPHDEPVQNESADGDSKKSRSRRTVRTVALECVAPVENIGNSGAGEKSPECCEHRYDSAPFDQRNQHTEMRDRGHEADSGKRKKLAQDQIRTRSRRRAVPASRTGSKAAGPGADRYAHRLALSTPHVAYAVPPQARTTPPQAGAHLRGALLYRRLPVRSPGRPIRR